MSTIGSLSSSPAALGAQGAQGAQGAGQPLQLNAKAKAAAKEFEAVFLGQMTKIMMESVDQGEMFSGGHGEEMFRGVMAEDLGREMVKGRGIGIADTVMAEMIRMQQGESK